MFVAGLETKNCVLCLLTHSASALNVIELAEESRYQTELSFALMTLYLLSKVWQSFASNVCFVATLL